jgi:hypothetical protein
MDYQRRRKLSKPIPAISRFGYDQQRIGMLEFAESARQQSSRDYDGRLEPTILWAILNIQENSNPIALEPWILLSPPRPSHSLLNPSLSR